MDESPPVPTPGLEPPAPRVRPPRQLSAAAQMRAARAEGLSVGEIARLFGVSYHHAYANVVTKAGSAPYSTKLAIAEASGVGGASADLIGLTNEALIRIQSQSGGGKRGAERRTAARKVLAERLPDEWG